MMSFFTLKFLDRLGWLSNAYFYKKYIQHNKSFFKQNLKNKNRSIVLLELNNLHSAHIAYSYLANTLAKKYSARIGAYLPSSQNTWFKNFINLFKYFFNLQEISIYRSFGTNFFFRIRITRSHKIIAKRYFSEIIQNLNTKQDVENLKINNVWVGDLFYDSYLKRYSKPTIELNTVEFSDYLLNSLGEFVFWEEYFNANNIAAINVSHCVYNLAIPLRIAISRDIPAFQTNISHLYRLDKKNFFAYNDFLYFKEIFASYSSTKKHDFLITAKSRIERRFLGEVGVDMPYSKKSAYSNNKLPPLLHKNNKIKILIATHCFFDSPHSYGNNLFPDFYEWLNFLGDVSESTDYDWYIKTHPDFIPGTKEVIENFLKIYPKFKLLPAEASHHQIIDEGINYALTVYGTIAFEYAALGVPVINCSLNNPHIAYNFNFHPKTIHEYHELLMNLSKLRLKIDLNEVYQYYFMRNIYNTENIFFDKLQETIDSIGGYKEQFSGLIYKCWLMQWQNLKHNKICQGVENFINSGDFRMTYEHFYKNSINEKIKL